MGVEAELETIAEAGHGFKGADEERAFKRSMDFLNRKLKPKLLETRRLMVTDHEPGGEILAIAWPSGRVLWRRPNHRGTELWLMPNGNVLYVEDPKGVVTEIDSEQKVVWQYKTEKVSLMSAQRLENGNTLLVDDTIPACIRSVARRQSGMERRKARIQRDSDAPRTADRGGHNDGGGTGCRIAAGTRRERRRGAQAGISASHAGARLPPADGGMLIGLAGPGEVRRVDPSGKTLVTYAGQNNAARMAWTSGFTQTPEGGLIVSDYMGGRIVGFRQQGHSRSPVEKYSLVGDQHRTIEIRAASARSPTLQTFG